MAIFTIETETTTNGKVAVIFYSDGKVVFKTQPIYASQDQAQIEMLDILKKQFPDKIG